MIRHFASLAAVLAALALVAAPEQAFAADVADDTRGAASEPVQTASDSADSSQVVASEPVQPVQPAQASAAGLRSVTTTPCDIEPYKVALLPLSLSAAKVVPPTTVGKTNISKVR